MDTEDFIVRRRALMARMEERRARSLSDYPVKVIGGYGIKLPIWARWGMSYLAGGSVLTRLLEIGLPLALPFFAKKQVPFLGRLLGRIFTSEA